MAIDMLSFTDPVWDFVFKMSTGGAAVFGTVSVVCAFVSAIVGYQITDATQREASTKIEQARAETQKAVERTEILRKQNLELEAAIAPRGLEQAKTSEALKRCAGMPVIVSVIRDFEARRFAGMIRVMLQMANWTIIRFDTTDTDLTDGVEIEYVFGHASGIEDQFPPELIERSGPITLFNERGSRAVDLLLQQFHDNHIQAIQRWIPARMAAKYRDQSLPVDAIVIRVGLKPTTYFTNTKIEEIKGQPGIHILDNR